MLQCCVLGIGRCHSRKSGALHVLFAVSERGGAPMSIGSFRRGTQPETETGRETEDGTETEREAVTTTDHETETETEDEAEDETEIETGGRTTRPNRPIRSYPARANPRVDLSFWHACLISESALFPNLSSAVSCPALS